MSWMKNTPSSVTSIDAIYRHMSWLAVCGSYKKMIATSWLELKSLISWRWSMFDFAQSYYNLQYRQKITMRWLYSIVWIIKRIINSLAIATLGASYTVYEMCHRPFKISCHKYIFDYHDTLACHVWIPSVLDTTIPCAYDFAIDVCLAQFWPP